MAVERKQLLMGGAAVIVLVIAVTLLRPASAPTPAAAPAPQQARAKSGRAQDADPSGPVAPVKLKALNETRDEPGDTKRNPFRFKPKPAPPPPPPPPPDKEKLPVTDAPRPVQPQERPLPPIGLKFTGTLTRADGTKWAVLSDGKSAPMFGKDGDIIDGKYLIVKIGTESIEMSYVDGRGRQVIRLTGQ